MSDIFYAVISLFSTLSPRPPSPLIFLVHFFFLMLPHTIPSHCGPKPGHFETSLIHFQSKQTNECSRGREWSKQCGASEWVSGVSERVNRRASGPVLTSRFLVVLNYCASWSANTAVSVTILVCFYQMNLISPKKKKNFLRLLSNNKIYINKILPNRRQIWVMLGGGQERKEKNELHYGSEQPDTEPLNHPFSHKLGSEWVSGASKRMRSAERASKASSGEQVNDWAVGANEQTDEQVAQYLRPDSWLFWTTVGRGRKKGEKRAAQSVWTADVDRRRF